MNMATAGGILAVALASFIGGNEFVTSECPGPCSSPPVHQRTANPRMDVSVTPKLVIDAVSTRSSPSDRSPSESPPTDAHNAAPETIAVAIEYPPAESTPATSVTPAPAGLPVDDPVADIPTPEPAAGLQSLAAVTAEPCTVAVATETSLRGPTATALASINAVTPNIAFVVADRGPISIGHGGEWPADKPPLGWTAPDRRTILINPNHPASLIDAALADVIVHELGHVLISTAHVHDGTILDPHIDGRISIGTTDRAYLGELTCADLGL